MQSLYYLALCAIVTAVLYSRRSRSSLPLPPGPKGLPLVGNLFDRPLDHPWLTYTQWASVYGEIASFKVLGQPVVIVNSGRVANELFEKRSNIYSDRPRKPSVFLREHRLADFSTTSFPHGG